jgi:glycine cleavage system H protein
VTNTPDELRYSSDHMWVRSGEDGAVRVGLTDFAQEALGDIVDISLPRIDDKLAAGEPCGDIESTKSSNDLIAPLRGTVTATNTSLTDQPDLINTDPYGEGWLYEALPAEDSALADLMSAADYTQLTGR